MLCAMSLPVLPTALLPSLGLALLVAIPSYAYRVRGRTYAIFAAVLLGLSVPAALVLERRLAGLLPDAGATWLQWGFGWLLIATGVHLASLVRARMRPAWFRFSVSLPGMAFLALGAMSLVWLTAWLLPRGVLYAFGAESALAGLAWLDWVPVLTILASIGTSMGIRREVVRFGLQGGEPTRVSRMPLERHRRGAEPDVEHRPLRIAQLTDTHLGPWQPVSRLRSLVAEVVEADPDLVLLTGDFLTMESNGTPGALAAALEPLGKLPGRCFAIFGNHDHEAPEEVRSGLAVNGVRLLLDEVAVAETPVGKVQIIGSDWHRRDAEERVRALLARHPRPPGCLRVLLLHDPSHFHHVPAGAVDLTLSGHTHGGQVGLVSLGIDWTLLSGSRWPDQGLFGHGASRLYVHRGTGFYGFPLRIGVPSELSVLEVVPADAHPDGGAIWRDAGHEPGGRQAGAAA